MSKVASSYRLPCVYCKDGVAFPSSDKLKEHLLGSHKNVVCGIKSNASEMFGADINKDERSVMGLKMRNPMTDPTKMLSDYSRTMISSPGKDSPSSSFTSPSSFIQTRSGDYEIVSTMQEKKIKRLTELLYIREKEKEKLLQENENLKSDSRIKDEEHSRVRQRWRKEAEDALRSLKTSYEDVLTQKRLMEKQIIVSEQEKEKLRANNDRLEKDLADLSATLASEKRSQQLKEDASNHPNNAVEKKAESSNKEMTRLLSVDLQMVRKENNTLAEALTSKDDTLKEMQQTLTDTKNKLIEEENKNDALNQEINTIKEQLAETETFVASLDQEQSQGNLEAQLNESLEMQHELTMNASYNKQKNDALLAVVETLKKEKINLVQKLQKADKSLVDLSSRVIPRSAPSCGIFSDVSSSVSIDQINSSLDEIKTIIKMLPQKQQSSEKLIELRHVQGELQQANIQLVEEKAKVLQLKNDLAEMERVVADDNYIHTEHDAKQKELQRLRTKHQQCMRNEKVRKQLAKEKKMLQRKYSTLHQQVQVLNTLYQSSQTDLTYKEQVIDELTLEKKQVANEAKCLRDDLDFTKKLATDNNVLLEKYKRESSYLLEKLNTATEEKEEMKKRNDSLEARLDELASFSDVKESLAFIQENLLELKSTANASSLSVDTNSSSSLETLTKRNIDLADKILSLQHKLSNDQQEFEILRKDIASKDQKISKCKQEIERLENQISNPDEHSSSDINLQKTMKESEYKGRIESLTLEKEILTSRILILEGIREEMDLLREEKDVLKVENQKLRRLVEQRGVSTTSLSATIDNNSKLVLVNNLETLNNEELEENLKKLEELDENTKTRLRELLSTPEFESFLSTDDVYIDLKNDSSSFDNLQNSLSQNSLSADSFEKEHTINHMFQAESDPLLCNSASYEDVIQVYTPSDNSSAEKVGTDINSAQQTNSMQTKTDSSVKPTAVTTAQENSPQTSLHKSLDKLFSESQSISKSIAAKRKTSGDVDCKKVLTEFQKVIGEMSGDNSSQTSLEDRKHSSFNRSKRVTFSDHVVDFYNDMEESDDSSPSSSVSPSIQSSDSNFYRSFFQDALKRTYPVLAKYEEEDIVNEIKEDDSNKNNNNIGSLTGNNSIRQSDVGILMHQQPTYITTESMRNGIGNYEQLATNSNLSITEEEQVVEEVTTEPTFDQILDIVSKSQNSNSSQVRQSIYDAVLKTLPQQSPSISRDKMKTTTLLPTLREEEEEEEDDKERKEIEGIHEIHNGMASKPLDVLKSFVNKAQGLKDEDSLESIQTPKSSFRENKTNNKFVIPTIIAESVDEPLYVNSSSGSSRNYGYTSDIRSNVTQHSTTISEDPGLVTSRDGSEFALGSITRDEMSCEEFGGSLFANDDSKDLNSNRLQVPDGRNLMASTPSVPSSLHRPASLDFSDASLADLSLFSNGKD